MRSASTNDRVQQALFALRPRNLLTSEALTSVQTHVNSLTEDGRRRLKACISEAVIRALNGDVDEVHAAARQLSPIEKEIFDAAMQEADSLDLQRRIYQKTQRLDVIAKTIPTLNAKLSRHGFVYRSYGKLHWQKR